MLHFLKVHVKKYKHNFIFFILLNILAWSISMSIPILNGKFIDILTLGEDKFVLKQVIIVVSILSIMNLLGGYILNIKFYKIITEIMQSIITEIMTYINKLPISFNYNVNPGYLSQRIMADANAVSNFTVSSVKDIPIKILTFVVSLIILLNINFTIGIILIILIPIYIGLYNISKKKMYKLNLRYKESESMYFEEINSQMESIKFIKVNALKTMFNNSLLANYRQFFTNLISYTKFSTLFSNVGSLVTVIANIIILIIGAIQIFDGKLTIGEFTIINTYFNAVIASVDYGLTYLKNYQNAMVSYNRIEEIFNKKEESVGDTCLSDIYNIELKDVSFGYVSNNVILNKFNYKFQKGKIYRIMGGNGTGKSSLLNLVIGLYNEMYQGEIKINDIDINEINIYKMRKELVGVIEQDLTIINGKLIENISLDKEYDLDVIDNLVERLDLMEFVERLEYGYESKISRKSYNLSGGEKQKINIIRNLLKNSKVLILDEANSALDFNSTEILKNIILKEKDDRITLIIAHSDIFNDIIDYKVELS